MKVATGLVWLSERSVVTEFVVTMDSPRCDDLAELPGGCGGNLCGPGARANGREWARVVDRRSIRCGFTLLDLPDFFWKGYLPGSEDWKKLRGELIQEHSRTVGFGLSPLNAQGKYGNIIEY